MSSANTQKYVKRSRGDPGESDAKQDVWYYSDVRAVFGILRGFVEHIFYKIIVCDCMVIFGTLVCDWLVIFGTPT